MRARRLRVRMRPAGTLLGCFVHAWLLCACAHCTHARTYARMHVQGRMHAPARAHACASLAACLPAWRVRAHCGCTHACSTHASTHTRPLRPSKFFTPLSTPPAWPGRRDHQALRAEGLHPARPEDDQRGPRPGGGPLRRQVWGRGGRECACGGCCREWARTRDPCMHAPCTTRQQWAASEQRLQAVTGPWAGALHVRRKHPASSKRTLPRRPVQEALLRRPGGLHLQRPRGGHGGCPACPALPQQDWLAPVHGALWTHSGRT